MKFNKMGISVYLKTFNEQQPFLESLKNEDRLAFISLHIPEENHDISNIISVLDWLRANKFKTICDISKRTLTTFNVETIAQLQEKINAYMLRIDFGFEIFEMIEASKLCDVVLNASTLSDENLSEFKDLYTMHNFYPRMYTGLSKDQFIKMNDNLKNFNILTFIPNINSPRHPIYEGLPTLEHQRFVSTYVSFIETSMNYNIDGIFLSDLSLDEYELKLIRKYENDNVISIPTLLFDEKFYDTVFTIRVDSPETSLRLQESREYATAGEIITKSNTTERVLGAITRDNEGYLRYSGEIQIIKQNLPSDPRVNVIGQVDLKYINLCNYISNGSKIMFVRPN